VIIDDLNIVRIAFSPNETETPLVIDPNAILARSVAMQRFQAISWWRPQISQFSGGVQLPYLPARNSLDCLEASTKLPAIKSLSFLGAKRLDHEYNSITLRS
jgi:hypothetical protein